jgi:hypothetical protein
VIRAFVAAITSSTAWPISRRSSLRFGRSAPQPIHAAGQDRAERDTGVKRIE